MRRQPASAALRIRHSFATVAEAFITDKLAQERSGKVAERDLRTIFIAAWGDRPISEITKPTCWRSSTPRSAPRRRWPARCWS